MKEKLYKVYYSDNDYIERYLKEGDIINGYLSEAKAFKLTFSDMILCNNYFKQDNIYDYIDDLVSSYDEDDDYYKDEYQFFIVNLEYDEDFTVKMVEKMGNTLYYDNRLDLYIMGVTDFGTGRNIVPTDIKVEELK